MKRSVIKKARKDATGEIKFQADMILSRNSVKLSIILAIFTAGGLFATGFYLADAVIYLIFGNINYYSIYGIRGDVLLIFLDSVISAIFLLPLLAGFRYMLLNTVKYGRTDIRDLFYLYSSPKLVLTGIRAALPTVIRISATAAVIIAIFSMSGILESFGADPYSATAPAVLTVTVLYIVFLYLTRMWPLNAYLALPGAIEGGYTRQSSRRARKKYYALTLMTGTVRSFAWQRILSLLTVMIYGVAWVYPKLLMCTALCAHRTLTLINNERKGQNS